MAHGFRGKAKCTIKAGEIHGSRNLKQSPPRTTADTGRQIQGAGSKGQASYNLQGWVFYEPPLPTRSCPLKTLHPPKTMLPAQNRHREHEPVGTISEPNHHTVDQLPPPSPSIPEAQGGLISIRSPRTCYNEYSKWPHVKASIWGEGFLPE